MKKHRPYSDYAVLSVIIGASGYLFTGIIGHIVGLILAIKAENDGDNSTMKTAGKILSIVGIFFDLALFFFLIAYFYMETKV